MTMIGIAAIDTRREETARAISPTDLSWSAPGRYFYLASPYSKWPDGIDDASHVIAKIAGKLIANGLPVFSPIAHSHTIARAAAIDPYSHEIWLGADKPLFEGAVAMIVATLPGWKDSFGIGEEIKWCRAHGKTVYLLDVETLLCEVLP